MIKYITGRSVGWFFLWAGVTFLPVACGSVIPPQRTVYIPPEYQRPFPASRPPVGGAAGAGQVRQQPSGNAPQQSILQPAPEIMERDLGSSPSQEYSMPPEVIAPSQSAKPAAPEPKAAPQQLASMRIVDQAKASMNQGDVDHAISLLEQAIQVDVYNGDAFYGLAQAWRMKGALDRSLEFSNKAGVVYKNNPSKLKQLYLFQADVYTTLQEHEKAAAYRQKASQL